jgi:predicted CXXCH cytochrome family protein
MVSTGSPGRGWIGGDCGGCHEIDEPWSHPVGIVPSIPVPPEFPLEDGRLVCTTCHDNRSSADHARARRFHEPLLRAVSPAALCAGCHDPTGTARGEMHATMLRRAHLRAPDGGAPAPPAVDVDGVQLDLESRTCLGCHDGSVAPAAAGASDRHGPLGARHAAPPLIGASHPVGVRYGRGRDRNLWSADTLDPRIRLFNQRVGCGSCHSPFARHKALLVMPNSASQLCLSCHDL